MANHDNQSKVNEQEKQTETKEQLNTQSKTTLFELQPWMSLVFKFPDGIDDIPITIISGEVVHFLRKPANASKSSDDDNYFDTSFRYFFAVEENKSNLEKIAIIQGALFTLFKSKYSILKRKDFCEIPKFLFNHELSIGFEHRSSLIFFFCNSSVIEEVNNEDIASNEKYSNAQTVKRNREFSESWCIEFIVTFILSRLPIAFAVKEKIFDDLLRQREFPCVEDSDSYIEYCTRNRIHNKNKN
jgi:hypothetical protein